MTVPARRSVPGMDQHHRHRHPATAPVRPFPTVTHEAHHPGEPMGTDTRTSPAVKVIAGIIVGTMCAAVAAVFLVGIVTIARWMV